MTDSSIIQQARDALAKWCEETTDLDGMPLNYLVPSGDLALIMGMTSPDLLDAIDKTLDQASKTRPTTEWGDHGLRVAGERLAAAIVAADERMSA